MALAAFPDQQTLLSQAYLKDFSKVFICDKSLLLLIRDVLGDQPENLYLNHLSYSRIFHNGLLNSAYLYCSGLISSLLISFLSMKRECSRIV